LKNFIRQSRYN